MVLKDFSPGVIKLAPDGTPLPAEQQGAPAPVEANEPGADLPLTVKKPARKAIRDLIGKLRNAPDEKWEETVALAVASELSIYHYVKAVSIRYALNEGGADEAFVARFLNHSACALIPEEVPRG